MIEIIPAIMPQSFKEMEEKVGSVHRLIKTVHLDVMDGSITPSVNWPFTEEGPKEMEKIIKGEIGLPFWKDINYEIDVMMQEPEASFEDWVNAGFHRIIIHPETTKRFVHLIKEWSGVVEIGAAVGVDMENEDAYQYIDAGADFVQFMGIYQIGFQGNPFDSRVFEKISKMKKVYPELPVSVDGGVNMSTALKLFISGADRLVIGSAIFKKNEGASGFQTFSEFLEGENLDLMNMVSDQHAREEEALNSFKKLASDYSTEKDQKK